MATKQSLRGGRDLSRVEPPVPLREHVERILRGDEPTFEIFSEGGGRCSIYYGGRVKGFPLKIVGLANQFSLLVRLLRWLNSQKETPRHQPDTLSGSVEALGTAFPDTDGLNPQKEEQQPE